MQGKVTGRGRTGGLSLAEIDAVGGAWQKCLHFISQDQPREVIISVSIRVFTMR